MVSGFLEKTNDYATTPAECYRFIKNQPIEKGYVMPETVIEDLRSVETAKEEN